MIRSMCLFLLVLCLIGVVSCGGDDNPTAPTTDITLPEINQTNTDWEVYMVVAPVQRDYRSMSLSAYYIFQDTNPISRNDLVQIKIDNTVYDLTFDWEDDGEIGWEREHIGPINLNTTHSVQLLHNGIVRATTTMKFPNVPNCSFPTTYDPRQAFNLAWTLDTDSPYQALRIEASYPDYQYADWFDVIAPSLRSYQIPANAVGYHDEGEYEVILWQANLIISNRVAFISQNYVSGLYPANRTAQITVPARQALMR